MDNLIKEQMNVYESVEKKITERVVDVKCPRVVSSIRFKVSSGVLPVTAEQLVTFLRQKGSIS